MAMMKIYKKPAMQVVALAHRHELLAVSLEDTYTNLDATDTIVIEEEDAGSSFWSR